MSIREKGERVRTDACLANAENCAELAERADNDADRKRYLRMAESWRQLARVEDWLEGRSPPIQLTT